jgi:choline-glycine betaine transporter
MPVVPAPPDDEMPRIEIAFVPELSIDTPGVNRTISEKSRMPFWSRSSWLIAVMLIGTLLMFSSRRVAVTTISSSAPVDAAPASAAPLASVAPAAAAANARLPATARRIRACRDEI